MWLSDLTLQTIGFRVLTLVLIVGIQGGILAGTIVESNYIYHIAKKINLIPIHFSMLISVLLRSLSIPILKKLK